MENPVMTQLLHFTAAVAFGGAAGVFYEICGLFAFMGGRWRRLACDFLFWALLLPGAFIFLLFLNGGGPRGYLLIGMAGGLAFVRFTMGASLTRLFTPWRRRLYEARRKRKAQAQRARAQKAQNRSERNRYGKGNGKAEKAAQTDY